MQFNLKLKERVNIEENKKVNEPITSSNSYNYGQNKVNKYHDKTFKNLFSNKKEAANFINKYLGLKGTKNEIKDIQLERCNIEFITAKKEKLESDILFKIRGEEFSF